MTSRTQKSEKKSEEPNAAGSAGKPQGGRRKKPLVVAPPSECFWVNYGPVLKDLRELKDALESGITDAQFAYHVRECKNDFADWIESVLKDKTCARAFRRAKTRKEALEVLERQLERYAEG